MTRKVLPAHAGQEGPEIGTAPTRWSTFEPEIRS